jgi:hypothetical protein
MIMLIVMKYVSTVDGGMTVLPPYAYCPFLSTPAWVVLRLQMEKTASRYGG